MNSESVAPSVNLQTILNAIPGNHVILLPDAPTFTIIAATDSFLKTSYTTREKILGRPLFEIFPDDRTNEKATGVANVRASLNCVIEQKEAHQMADQRYDIANPHTGAFEFKVWAAANTPVLRADGAIQCIIHTTEDITERVQLQEENALRKERLTESESRFRLMVEQAPVPVLLSSGEDVVIESLNAPMLKAMNKASFGDVLGKKMLEVLPELEDQAVLQIVKGVQKTGVPFKGDEVPTDVVIDGKLKRFYFNYSYTPIIEGGEIAGVLHVALDVTPQVEARKKIEESAVALKRFKFMADNAEDPFLLIREDGTFAYLNKKALQVWGYTEEEAAQLRVPDIDPIYQEETFRLAFSQILAQPVSHLETQYRRKDGCVYPVEGSINGMVLDGKPHLFVVARDITERKKAEAAIRQSEQNLRNTILHAPVAMFIFRGENMVIDTVNEKALEMIKRTAAVVGKPLLEAIPELTGSPAYEIFKQVYRTGVTQYGREVLVPLERAGALEDRYFNFTYTPLIEAGQVVGVIDVATDVTGQVLARQKIEEVVAQRTGELAQANEALLQANKELQRSNANLEEFAHAASHDLKEPIRKITFFTQRLKEQLQERLDDAEQMSFARIARATERMGSLIDDLLLYSHVSQRPHETDAVDLGVKVQRVLEDLELDIQEKKAVIRVGKLPVVQGYRRQLQQLFQNLISNALKYSKTDVAPVVDITAGKATEGEREYRVIAVKDNGIGFDEAYTDKIFQMFARLHGKDEYSGTGVGLSIVKKVVENHNGFIRVKSTPGAGSTFTVYLPV